MNDYTETELATYFADRDRAESEGLYDTIENPSTIPMTDEQEVTLATACSWLSDLAKETNSTISEILKRGGLAA